MKTWIVKAQADFYQSSHTAGVETGRTLQTREIQRTILTQFSALAVAYVNATYATCANYKLLSCEAGPDVDTIIPVDNGLGPVNR